ncbi:MAG: GTPase [Thermotogaceae bacterium]|jgi:GTP-binding protein HflX|nr:GTPase [Thermotogaceae bacterium]
MERVLIVNVGLKGHSLIELKEVQEELKGLVETAGGEVVETIHQFRDRLNGATLIGKGKLNEIKPIILEREIDLVVFDNKLSPTQLRNIEAVLDCRVIDRIQLILDIFARHATTKEGKLQIELAQLEYLLPRILGMGKEMSRLGGGIGTRGPGETKLEVSRRTIRQRIFLLKKQLIRIKKQREIRRKRRLNANTSIVSIIGYTNSGKTTLLKSLSKDEKIKPKDELFATLSPVSRKVYLGNNKQAVFNDTVGFIRNLPHNIIESFKATLEEITFSDLIIHVIDCSESNWKEKMSSADVVLKSISAMDIPKIRVLNKIDLLTDEEIELLRVSHPDYRLISSAKKSGLDELKMEILNFFEEKAIQ